MCPRKAIAKSRPSAVYKEDKPLPPRHCPAEALALDVAGEGGGGGGRGGPKYFLAGHHASLNRLELVE